MNIRSQQSHICSKDHNSICRHRCLLSSGVLCWWRDAARGSPGVVSVDWLLRSRDRGQRALSQERVDGAVTDSDQFLLFSFYAVGQK